MPFTAHQTTAVSHARGVRAKDMASLAPLGSAGSPGITGISNFGHGQAAAIAAHC
jgi:hypothetical protein